MRSFSEIFVAFCKSVPTAMEHIHDERTFQGDKVLKFLCGRISPKEASRRGCAVQFSSVSALTPLIAAVLGWSRGPGHLGSAVWPLRRVPVILVWGGHLRPCACSKVCCVILSRCEHPVTVNSL